MCRKFVFAIAYASKCHVKRHSCLRKLKSQPNNELEMCSLAYITPVYRLLLGNSYATEKISVTNVLLPNHCLEMNVVPTESSIDQLIIGCKAADPKAQMALYDLYAAAMYRVAFRIIGQSDEAEDAVQESMLSAFNSMDQFRGEVTFGAWLKKIVINKSIRLKQKQARVLWKNHLDETPSESVFQIEQDEEDNPQQNDIKRIEHVLAKLPTQQALIVRLFYKEGLEHAEIAHYLNISEANCRTSLSRAKETMRKLLNV